MFLIGFLIEYKYYAALLNHYYSDKCPIVHKVNAQTYKFYKRIINAGMILALQVFYTLDSKHALCYTTVRHNVNMPGSA